MFFIESNLDPSILTIRHFGARPFDTWCSTIRSFGARVSKPFARPSSWLGYVQAGPDTADGSMPALHPVGRAVVSVRGGGVEIVEASGADVSVEAGALGASDDSVMLSLHSLFSVFLPSSQSSFPLPSLHSLFSVCLRTPVILFPLLSLPYLVR